MNVILKFAAAALMLGAAACATSTPYGPATGQNPYGFSEQRIEQDRYRIVFRGNSSTTRETVETFLLFRAAELTVQNGYDHFVVTEQDTEESRRYTRSSPAYYGRYPYGFGRYCCAFPYYAYGWGWGSDPFYDDVREITRYSAIAFIAMGKGPKPADNPQAFDARDVVQSLSSAVQAAQPK
jgi:hypothetical protein